MIKITGIGVVSALGVGVESNLVALRAGQSGLDGVRLFQTNHRVPVGEVKMDNSALKNRLGLDQNATFSRTALLGMLAAKEALTDANFEKKNDLKIGLISSTSVGGMDLTERFYRDFMVDQNKGRLRLAAHHDSADSTIAIAQYCGIGDFSTTISTACSSAANAIMLGARMLQAGLLDVVVAGGTDSLCQFTLNGFKSLMILDENRCRPFDDTRAGLNLGEGAGYIVMQRAEHPSAKDYGYLLGFANTNDAHHQTATSQSGDGAFLSMSKAMQMAHLSTGEIDYINVHGTGTGNNDASEAAALQRIFGDQIPPFSSTKAFTGHTLAAAGGIEAVFALLSIQHGEIWPNLNFHTPMHELPLMPETTLVSGKNLQTVMSNSFGFGGNCATLIFGKNAPKSDENWHEKPVYINIAQSDAKLTDDVKTLIPDAALRRRMSRLVKSGVSVGMACVQRCSQPIDAIITATGFGCLDDSEKFLRTLIENDEQLLNPTPFIQSTFNTVGGQIGLLCKNHCYNMTYTHRGRSFESALMDAMLLIQSGEAHCVLLGAFDQNTPSQLKIMERMGLWRHATAGEGAYFFVLSDSKNDSTLAQIFMPEFLDHLPENVEVDYSDCGTFHTASAAKLFDAITNGKSSGCVYNCYFGKLPTRISFSNLKI